MLINELKKNYHSPSKKRIGRGGRRGTYSGRGQKGQKARAGHKIKPAEREQLIQRLPKLRGYKNRRRTPANLILNIRDLNKLKIKKLSWATAQSLGLIPKTFRGRIKVLGSGNLNYPVIISPNIFVSASAKTKIVAAGGRLETEKTEKTKKTEKLS